MLIELVFTNLPQQYSLPLSYKNTSVQVKWLSPTNSVIGAPPGTNLRPAIGYRLLRYSTAMQPFVFQTGGHSPPIYLLICSYPQPKYISLGSQILKPLHTYVPHAIHIMLMHVSSGAMMR